MACKGIIPLLTTNLFQLGGVSHLNGNHLPASGTDREDLLRSNAHPFMKRAKINEIRCLYEFGAVAFFAYHFHLLLILIIRQQEVFGFVLRESGIVPFTCF